MERIRVAMLANNDWRIDSRVVREAEALERNGYEVTVVFRRDAAAHGFVEECNGVRYVCVPRARFSPGDLVALLRIHVRVLAGDAGRLLRGPCRSSAVVSALQLAASPLVAILGLFALPVFAVLFAGRRRLSAVRAFVTYLVQPLLYLNEYALRCTAAVRALDPHIVHAHDLITLSCAYRVARSGSAPFIYDAHELESHTNYWTLNRWTGYWVRRYEHALMHAASGSITVSDSIADWLAREYRVPRPTVVLNVPVTLGQPEAQTIEKRVTGLRGTLALAPDVPLAVYVGSVTIDRGLELCVRALAHVPDLHFAFVGPRYAKTEAEVGRIARELAVDRRLHLVDPVPSSEVVRFIADANCSVIAVQNVCLSYYFALPNKLFESAMAGLPVAAANLIELRRFVEQNGIGVVMDERDPKDIARMITEVLRAPQRYRPTSAKLTQIAERYGWPVQEKKLLQLYSTTAQRARACYNRTTAAERAYPS